MSDRCLTLDRASKCYPPSLLDLARPPQIIYLRGNPDILNHPHLLAVVGSRRATHQGINNGQRLLTPAVKSGLVLVSGLAWGVDSLAHRLCVEHNQPTIAVLGCGLDDATIYPHQNLKLAHQIINNGGAIISEHPPQTPALPGHFPSRNRIIAALAPITLVLQAARRSGSLITARLALETGREVWAVPGDISDSLASGTNHLIQQGAMPIIDPADIIDLFQLAQPQTTISEQQNLTPSQKTLIKILSAEPQHIDDLSTKLNQPTSNVSILLMELELVDAVQHVGGMRYIKS